MNARKLDDLSQTDLFCLFNDWLAGEVEGERAREIAADVARRDSIIFGAIDALDEAVRPLQQAEADDVPPVPGDPAAIRLAPADQPGDIPRRRATRPVPPWFLALAAALLAAVSIGWLALYWKSGGNPNARDQQVNDLPEGGQPGSDPSPRPKLESPPNPSSVIVEKPKEAEKPLLAPPGELPPGQAIVKDDPPKSQAPITPASEPETLLAAIGQYKLAQPLDVMAPEIRALRARAIAYQKQPASRPEAVIAEFVARSTETDDNERKYLEFFAAEAETSPQAPAKVADCVARIMALRFTQPALVSKDKPLILFLDKALAVRTPALDAGLRTQVARVIEALPEPDRLQPKKRAMLLCVLPPDLQQGSIALLGDLQRYARGKGDPLDPTLLDFLLRARRPTDTLGMIIPVFWSNLETLSPQEAATVQGQWRATLAVAARGVPVKVINRLQTSLAVRSEQYAQALLQAKRLKIGMYAYVNTDGGGKKLEDAKTELRQWDRLYPGLLSGIFIDNLPNGNHGNLKYFQDLYSYALSIDKSWRLIGCSDKLSEEEYLTLTPNGIFCVDSDVTEPVDKEWQVKHDPSRFAAIIRRPDDALSVKEIIGRAAAAHYSWIYVTEKGAVSRENDKTLPSYFEQEALILRDLNDAIRGKAAEAPAAKKQATKKTGKR